MRILIVKTSAIGDVIQTFPVLDYLKQKYPEALIDWIVEKNSVDLVAAHPYVHRVIAIDTKKWRKKLFDRSTWKEIKAVRKNLTLNHYDLLFDLQGNSKSALFTFWANAKTKVGYGFKTLPEKLNGLVTNCRFNGPREINVRLHYLHLVQSYFKDFREVPNTSANHKNLRPGTLMVCFGSKWKNKQLPQKTLEQLLELIQGKFGLSFLFVFGNAEEKKVAEALHAQFQKSTIIGNLSLVQLQKMMEEVNIVLSMDSATLHLCGMTSTPSFSVFGPSSANAYKPLGAQHTAFQGSCPYGKTFVKRCPILRTCETGACLRDLTAESLFTAFTDFYEGN